uniref:EGF-like domain-containing protein n=1 Tax=Mola mola TaxID=94237 RepID=A0A3Q3VIR5_MOLML
MEDISAGPAPPPGSASPTRSTVDTGQVPKEKPEETEAAGESGEEGAEGSAEGGGDHDGEQLGALGIVALPGTCCVCVEMEQIDNCLHSEKICILPILACLLSLALCTAGLKWVFVDKIFDYEPPTHLDPKRMGQDPITISVDPTLGLTVSITLGRPDILAEDKSTWRPYVPQSPRVTQSDPSVTLKYNALHPTDPTVPKQTPPAQTTEEVNDILIPTISATSTTTTAKTSSHVTRCSDSQRNYCVNGGECFTLEIMPGSTKFLCRCPNEFTGDRCQNYVMASFYKAEELYQKRILTISGICIALLVVGIMCVVAYCKTKKQRKQLHDRLRQILRNKRNNNTSSGRSTSNLALEDLQLINQCNGTIVHAAEKETETTFSTTKYALSGHEATTFTHVSSQSWSNDWSNSVLSDTESVSVISLPENSQRATRGRLNATGGTRDLSANSKKSRDTSSYDRDLFAFATTTPTCLSAMSRTSLTTPGSPPSEMSAPLSSLAISVPSVALSPSGEEERPLLLSNPCQPHKSSSRDELKRSSVHYNHGHVADSLPPSPLFTMGNGDHQITKCDHDTTGASHIISALSENMLISETEEPLGENSPFFTADSTTALSLMAMYSSRTTTESPNDDLQVKLPSTAPKQDLITV